MSRKKPYQPTTDKTEPPTAGVLQMISFAQFTAPVFKEVKGKDYVYFGTDQQGGKNQYPNFLAKLYHNSAKHNAIVNSKVGYISGKGFVINDSAVTTEQMAVLTEKVKNINPEESAKSVLVKCTLDLEIYNGYCMEVIWAKNKKDWSEIRHIPFNRVRTNKDKSRFYYSKDWGQYNQTPEKTDYEEFEPFNMDKRAGKQLLYVMIPSVPEDGSLDVYPYPPYIGCVNYIECDTEIPNFHLNNIKNGFWGGMLINFFNGTPTPEEQLRIQRMISAKHTGTNNTGRFAIMHNNPGANPATIEPLQVSDLADQFDILNEQVQQEILFAHRVTNPMLFGIKTEGQLGGRTELKESFDQMEQNYFCERRSILEHTFNSLYAINGYPDALTIVGNQPLGFNIPEETIIANMTGDEIREKGGLKPLNSTEVGASKFSKEDTKKAIEVFSKYGKDSNLLTVVKEKKVLFSSANECAESEIDFYKESFEVSYRASDVDRKIMKVLDQKPTISIKDLARETKESMDDVLQSITRLTENGLVNISETREGNEIKVKRVVTDKGKGVEVGGVNVFIVYKYDGPYDDKNRDFCRELLNLNRSYTRKDIDAISSELGYDVWRMRGGFYHNPRTDITTPYCRHTWKQQVVTERR